MQKELTKQAEEALALAGSSARECGHSYIGTEHILLGLLNEQDGTAGKVMRHMGADTERLSELIQKLIAPSDLQTIPEEPKMSPRALSLLADAEEECREMGHEKVGTEHILLAMLKKQNCVGTRLLHTMGINIQKLHVAVLSAMGYDNDAINYAFQNYRAGRGRQDGATPNLDQYSRDLTALAAEGKLDPVIGREKETNRILQILSRRTKNNPCLVGEPGVGKTAIAEGLAQRIVAGNVPESVQGMRVVVLDLAGMVAGSKYRGEFEERIRNVVDEVRENKGILLFIDELHTIIGAGGAEGALDASNILKPSLSRGEIQVIGATTLEEYRKYIEKDAALERRFQPVTVEEPDVKEAVEILYGLRPCYEEHHKVKIKDEAIEAAVKMSERYISDRFLPDKAIDVIDEASARVRLKFASIEGGPEARLSEMKDLEARKEEAIRNADLEAVREIRKEQEALKKEIESFDPQKGRKISRQLEVTESAVADIISEWTKIPVQRLTEGETKRLARLEKELHKRVIGQDEAVHAVSQAVKRGRVGLKNPDRPIGSFLFLGPTGVGKTELSKALSEAVFGSEQSMIRVDMSEYMEKHSVSKLIGSPPGYVGYDEGGQLSEKVRRNPYSVILFDEIEKAHPDVFNILLQVLDDGHITDAHGRRVDFKQTIIIMTSNAGAQAIIEPKRLGFVSGNQEEADYERMKSGVMEEVRRIFRPEFLNRIDEIIVFHMLKKEDIRKIVGILLSELITRCSEQLQIHLSVTPKARDILCEAGYDSKYGARPLRRAIQTKLEDALANEILEGRIKRGANVTVRYKDSRFIFDASGQQDEQAVNKADKGDI